MALVSELAAAIAGVEGIQPATMDLLARHVREAGFLTTGPRGRNAPPATVADAVNILIAANAGGGIVRYAPDAIPLYRRLVSTGGYRGFEARGAGVEYFPIDEDPLTFLNEPATLGDTLQTIVEKFMSEGAESLSVYLIKRALMDFPPGVAEYAKSNYLDENERLAFLHEHAVSALKAETEVKFHLTFYRPNPRAELRVSTRGHDLAFVNFHMSGADLTEAEHAGRFRAWDGDRREAVTIGYRTFSKIADVLRDGEDNPEKPAVMRASPLEGA
jgi:hypothetical protein